MCQLVKKPSLLLVKVDATEAVIVVPAGTELRVRVKFKGKCEELKGYIYKISSSGADSFTRVNHEVADTWRALSLVPASSELP